MIEGHELGPRLAARVPVAARELQAGLVGLAAAVAEEGAAQARRAGQAIARAAPAADGRTGSTCARARAPARRWRRRCGCCRCRARRRRCPTAGRGTTRPSASNRRTPSPRTNATGKRRYVCRTCRASRAWMSLVAVVSTVPLDMDLLHRDARARGLGEALRIAPVNNRDLARRRHRARRGRRAAWRSCRPRPCRRRSGRRCPRGRAGESSAPAGRTRRRCRRR